MGEEKTTKEAGNEKVMRDYGVVFEFETYIRCVPTTIQLKFCKYNIT